MIRTRIPVAAIAVLASFATPATAQEVLFGRLDVYVGTPIIGALNDLGLDYTTVVRSELLRDALRSQEWDLVIVRTNRLFETDPLPELEAHVASGGALHFQMADLDSAPQRYLDLLGLEGAVDLELPLHDLVAVESPRHPSMPFSGLPLFDELFGPDLGDELLPTQRSRTIIRYEGGGNCTVVSQSGRVIVNGHEWDNWSMGTGGGASIVAQQIRWLLRCPADLDLDGTTTLNDFLVFQNLFAADDPSVDFDGDGALTVFDFLAFLNQFDAGC